MRQVEKKCIFHIPGYVDSAGTSGSSVRPYKMLNALKEQGYNVDVVMGYGKERKAQIQAIKAKIDSGVTYDFLYSESSTMPTLLTEKHHLPLYPLLDFGFFRYCKEKHIKIGLFYRDIYWKFPLYNEQVPLWKRIPGVLLYKYDLFQYNRLLDVLFLPSCEMKRYLPILSKSLIVKALPPGTSPQMIDANIQNSRELQLLYVGGISKDVYDLTNLLAALKDLPCAHLIICCRKDDWNLEKANYEPYFTDRIRVVHTSGSGLDDYYRKADICCLITNVSEYRSFSMPVKLFEYLSYEKPILITEGSTGAKFVEENEIGYVIKDDISDIKRVLTLLLDNPESVIQKREILRSVSLKNSWSERVFTVIQALTKNVE